MNTKKGFKGFVKGMSPWNKNKKFSNKEYPTYGMTGKKAWNKGKTNPQLSKRQRENNVSKREDVKIKLRKAKKEYFSKGNHPWNYIDGSSRNRFYRLQEWIKIAKECYKKDNWTCQTCGKKGGVLNAHHKIPYSISKDNSLNNLITLCVPCHSRIHMTINNPKKRVTIGESQEVSQ